MNIIKKSREKKFNKQYSNFKNKSNIKIVDMVKVLYIDGEIDRIDSAFKLIKSIKIKKDGSFFKGEKNEINYNKLNEKFSNIKLKKFTKVNEIFSSSSHLKYNHILPELFQTNISADETDNIENTFKKILDLHDQPEGSKIRIKIILEDDEIDEQLNTKKPIEISTAFQNTKQEALDYMMTEQIGPKGREYESNFRIKSIEISFFKVHTELMGASNPKTIEQADKKWFIVNPVSKKNCLFHSIACNRNYKKKFSLLNPSLQDLKNSGKELKKAVKPTRKGFSDDGTIQEICEYVKTPIILYNNLFQIIKEFNPIILKNKEPYEIQRCENHCKALIRKVEIKKAYKEYDFYYNKLLNKKEIAEIELHKKEMEEDEEEGAEEEEFETLIKKKKYKHKYNYKIATWDIEATPGKDKNFISYAVSLAWYDYELEPEKPKKKGKIIKESDDVYQTEPEKERQLIKENEIQFWGLDALDQFLIYLSNNKEMFDGFTLYGHNAGKFDLPLLIDQSLLNKKESQFKIKGDGCLELNNSWIGFTLESRTDEKFRLFFRDSIRLLPMSLEKLTQELKVKHQKLAETVNHDDITIDNYMNFPQLKKYLKHDTLGLLECMKKFGKEIYDELGIDITRCYTGASLSKINFFKNYYEVAYRKITTNGEQKNILNKGVFTLTDEQDKFIRSSYFGGRVEAFNLGCIKTDKDKKFYYYDFTSLYPDVGRKAMPVLNPKLINFNNENKIIKNWFGFVRCLVKTKDYKALPKHAILKDKRLIFPIFETYTEINIFSAEIDYDIYDYKFIDGYAFEKSNFLSRFFSEGFRKKAEAKKNGKLGMAQAYKIIINSGYGFWGLRTKNRDSVLICDNESPDYIKYLNDGKLKSIMETEDVTYCRVLKDLEVKDFNVAVAAAISSYARLKLHSLISMIRLKGGNVYYCDTDSVICDINLNDHKDIQKKFQWDGDGSELGSLKNEADEYIEKILINNSINNKIKNEPEKTNKLINKEIIKNDLENNEKTRELVLKQYKNHLKSIFNKDLIKEQYNELLKENNFNFYFDELIITGCKQYALRKKIIIDGKEEIIEIVKLKGYSQKGKDILKFNDMDKLTKGAEIKQNQMQFNCPKSNYVSETSGFKIKKTNVNKKFRMVYSKGIINENNTITPHIL